MTEVCLPCERVYRTKEAGRQIVLFTEDDKISAVFEADIMICPECHHEIVAGFGQSLGDKPQLIHKNRKPFRAVR